MTDVHPQPVIWCAATLADHLATGLRAAAEARDREQAVFGLDALDELELHPVLTEGLETAGYGVAREQRFPADWKKRRETEGERCDFVLTPDGRELRRPERRATLFDDPDAVELDEALWLEVKVVAQFNELGANGQYASTLLGAVTQDVPKLAKDDGIRHAALLIVMFVVEEAVATHDLAVWENRCHERGYAIDAPRRRTFPITDRLGNRFCVLSVYPVRTTV